MLAPEFEDCYVRVMIAIGRRYDRTNERDQKEFITLYKQLNYIDSESIKKITDCYINENHQTANIEGYFKKKYREIVENFKTKKENEFQSGNAVPMGYNYEQQQLFFICVRLIFINQNRLKQNIQIEALNNIWINNRDERLTMLLKAEKDRLEKIDERSTDEEHNVVAFDHGEKSGGTEENRDDLPF